MIGGEARAPLEEAARLLRGERVTSSDENRLLRFLLGRRMAAEVAASPGIAGLSREARRRLAVERESVRSAAASRVPAVERVALVLEAAGLGAVLLKGEAIVALTHGDASRRPMVDLDVLVRPAERQHAVAALLAAGFEPTTADSPLHAVLRYRGTRGPLGHGVPIELHVDVLEPPHPFPLDLEGVRQRASAYRGGLLLPSLEDAIALTAFQLAVHETDARKTLLHLRDVALLLEASSRQGRTACLAPIVARHGLVAIVRAVVERAVARAGAPPEAVGWCGEAPRLGMRRRFALKLALSEMDAGLVADEPPRRELSRRVSILLWQASWKGSGVALVGVVRRKARPREAWAMASRRMRALWASLRGGSA